MLYYLTGEVQIGKTRWLMKRVDELERRRVEVCGVVAPGIWKPHDDGGFEKLGITNVLLPEHRVIQFARRLDIAQGEGCYDESSQSSRAGLRWAIDDEAIAEVNAHFVKLSQLAESESRVLIIDELGQLELRRGEGLTNAVSLLEGGAACKFRDAIVVVRADLLPLARDRFASADWGGMQVIVPGDLDL